MAKPFQFRLATVFVLMAFIAFVLQVAMLAWVKGYGEIISQTIAIFALAGLLWLAPILPAILGRRR